MLPHLLITWVLLPYTYGLIGYDCASGNTNITQISLKDVGNCEVPKLTVTTKKTYLQLLQLDNVKTIHVIQCRVLIKRTVQHCGMHSHISAVSRESSPHAVLL